MLLIGMLGDNSGSLDNDVQTLLKPMHIRCQSDEMLEIAVSQDTVSDALADERTNTVLRDFLKRGISPFAELLKRTPSRSWNKGQGGRACKCGGHGETSTTRVAQFQRNSNEIVAFALWRYGAEITAESKHEDHIWQIPVEPNIAGLFPPTQFQPKIPMP
jgi:hypothetical protein